jgi:hypothetical protein
MKTTPIVFAAALLAGTTLSFAAGPMNSMDTNADGMVSKQEFLSHHEAMYDKMDKGGKGMMPVRDMEMSMRSQMMRGERASRADKTKMDQRARTGEGPSTTTTAPK